MTGEATGIMVETIPVDRITVLNPRVRDRRKSREMVENIDKVGLKQPIKVSRITGSNGDAAYNLVYGQGRLEAYISLGQREIPAIVTELSEEESLIMSLVENVARRHRPPMELLREIGALKERGYTDTQIGRKIGYARTYVRGIRRLLESGEERLLIAVETGRMPLNVAIDIAAAEDERVQEVLADAYDNRELRGRQFIEAKRLVEQRQRFGKARSPAQRDTGRKRSTSAAIVRSLKNQAQRQRLIIKQAEVTSSRLRFIVQGLRMLLADENFVTLLRAEGVHTLPAPLAGLLDDLEED